MNKIHQRVFKIWGLINFNTKTLTLWLFYKNSKSVTLFPRSPRGGDGADKNFRPISTIMPYMNKIHQRVFKIWGLINFNAKTLTLWQKDERTYEWTNKRTYERTDERKSENYIPLHTSYVGGITRASAKRVTNIPGWRHFFIIKYFEVNDNDIRQDIVYNVISKWHWSIIPSTTFLE